MLCRGFIVLTRVLQCSANGSLGFTATIPAWPGFSSQRVYDTLQVKADELLAHALQLHPLLLTVYKQGGATAGRNNGRGIVTAIAAAVPVGSAEIDLSPLLFPRCLFSLCAKCKKVLQAHC